MNPRIDFRFVVTSVFYLAALLLFSLQQSRGNFIELISIYSLSFVAYLILFKQNQVPFRHYAFVALLGHLIVFFAYPILSNDFYRFIWDGELITKGINPYDFKPAELITRSDFNSTYFRELYAGMGELSRQNYSCYPILNQFYFAIAALLSNTLLINLFVLKGLILLSIYVVFHFGKKILHVIQVNDKRVWLLFLNPLWIIETIGNVHFEAVMIAFMLAGIYYLLERKLFIGALYLSGAIQIKLLPVIVLPFFYRYLGFLKSTLLYSIILVLLVLSSMILLNTTNILNFTESLVLYFKAFEFNSFIYYQYLEYGWRVYGWQLNYLYGPRMTRYIIFALAILSLYGDIKGAKKLLYRLTLGFFVYLLLGTTIHPWYLLTLLALGIFTGLSSIVLWTYTVFLSYSFYAVELISEEGYRMLVEIEYGLVITALIYELIRRRALFPFLDLKSCS